MEEDDSYEAEG
uniref:Cytohesin 1 n=1 Tax=Homo sapiens TaxID=9606 RepID=K7EL72_HUMAN